MDTLQGFLFLIPLIGAVYGLVWWACRAETDRSAMVGLYLLYGIPGGLLIVAGAAALVNGLTIGWLLSGLGVGLALPLVKSIRTTLSRLIPMDPESPIDMMGLGVILAVSAMLGYSLTIDTGADVDIPRITFGEQLITVVSFVMVAFLSVGATIHRTVGGARVRLGITLPNLTALLPAKVMALAEKLRAENGNFADKLGGFIVLFLVGAAAVVPAFALSAIGSLLTFVFQPELFEVISDRTEEMASGTDVLLLNMVLLASAGIGEEILFRGAIQPRFGIVLTSAFWALVHTQYQFSFVIFGLFLVGILFGLIRKHMGTTPAIIAHALYNACVVLLQSVAG